MNPEERKPEAQKINIEFIEELRSYVHVLPITSIPLWMSHYPNWFPSMTHILKLDSSSDDYRYRENVRQIKTALSERILQLLSDNSKEHFINFNEVDDKSWDKIENWIHEACQGKIDQAPVKNFRSIFKPWIQKNPENRLILSAKGLTTTEKVERVEELHREVSNYKEAIKLFNKEMKRKGQIGYKDYSSFKSARYRIRSQK